MNDEDGFLIPSVLALEGQGMEELYDHLIRPLLERLRSKGGSSKVRRSSEGYRIWLEAPEFYRPKMHAMLVMLGRFVTHLQTLPRGVTEDELVAAMDRALKRIDQDTPS